MTDTQPITPLPGYEAKLPNGHTISANQLSNGDYILVFVRDQIDGDTEKLCQHSHIEKGKYISKIILSKEAYVTLCEIGVRLLSEPINNK